MFLALGIIVYCVVPTEYLRCVWIEIDGVIIILVKVGGVRKRSFVLLFFVWKFTIPQVGKYLNLSSGILVFILLLWKWERWEMKLGSYVVSLSVFFSSLLFSSPLSYWLLVVSSRYRC